MRALRTLSLGLSLLFAATALTQQSSPPPKPQPDVLVFTNGDQLTGKLLRADSGNVVFKSDMAGELTIPYDKVKELRSGGSFSLLKKGTPSKSNLVGQGQIDVADGNVTVTQVPPVTLAIKEVGYVIDTPTYDRELHRGVPFTQGWIGAITAGATIVRSTDDITSFTAGIALARLMPTVDFLPRRNRTTFNLIETYGKATSPVIPQTVPPSPSPVITKTSIFHSDAERDEYFTPRLYGLGNVAFDHNFSQGLNLQQLYGVGIGWTAIQTARQQLDLKADIHYERQSFFGQPDASLIGSIFGEAYRRDLPRKIVFTQVADYVPSWNDSHVYSAMATAGIVLPTWKRLGASLAVTDNFLNNPSPGYKKNSFQFVAGLNYTLK
ncbi:MAG TPA: DUF481 domain-containing protein [Acidobacteriaceae bacterium]|nr:DUF481 domain-containing protein [Acidobacteriaceae bacterium]